MPFARRNGSAERPCRMLLVNRFLSVPCLFNDNKMYLLIYLLCLYWNNVYSDVMETKVGTHSTFPFGNIIELPTLQQIY